MTIQGIFYLIVSFDFLAKYNLHVISPNIIFTIMNSFPYNKSRLIYLFSREPLDVSETPVTQKKGKIWYAIVFLFLEKNKNCSKCQFPDSLVFWELKLML